LKWEWNRYIYIYISIVPPPFFSRKKALVFCNIIILRHILSKNLVWAMLLLFSLYFNDLTACYWQDFNAHLLNSMLLTGLSLITAFSCKVPSLYLEPYSFLVLDSFTWNVSPNISSLQNFISFYLLNLCNFYHF